MLPGAPWAAGYEALLDTADEQPTARAPLDAGTPLALAPWTVRVLRALRRLISLDCADTPDTPSMVCRRTSAV